MLRWLQRLLTQPREGSVQCSQFWIRSSLSLTPLPVLLSSLFAFLSKKSKKIPLPFPVFFPSGTVSPSFSIPFRYCFPFLYSGFRYISLPVLFPLPLLWLPLLSPSGTISPSCSIPSLTVPHPLPFHSPSVSVLCPSHQYAGWPVTPVWHLPSFPLPLRCTSVQS